MLRMYSRFVTFLTVRLFGMDIYVLSIHLLTAFQKSSKFWNDHFPADFSESFLPWRIFTMNACPPFFWKLYAALISDY